MHTKYFSKSNVQNKQTFRKVGSHVENECSIFDFKFFKDFYFAEFDKEEVSYPKKTKKRKRQLSPSSEDKSNKRTKVDHMPIFEQIMGQQNIQILTPEEVKVFK